MTINTVLTNKKYNYSMIKDKLEVNKKVVDFSSLPVIEDLVENKEDWYVFNDSIYGSLYVDNYQQSIFLGDNLFKELQIKDISNITTDELKSIIDYLNLTEQERRSIRKGRGVK